MVSPGDFIQVAEETELIEPMGHWILETACRASISFQKAISRPICVSINLSGRQLESEELVSDVCRIVERTGASPSLIKLEVTESVLMADPVRALKSLNELKQMGFSIALDDFGTGYSSFSYLHRFPIDTLKIDRSFTSTMLSNAKSQEIVRTLCDLARSIGLTVIAEGVESAEERDVLAGYRAKAGQGFFCKATGRGRVHLIA